MDVWNCYYRLLILTLNITRTFIPILTQTSFTNVIFLRWQTRTFLMASRYEKSFAEKTYVTDIKKTAFAHILHIQGKQESG